MVEAGIIDPKMVVRSEIENASSVAAIFLTMECAVCDIPEEKKDEGHGHGGGMGGMGMM
jgi:chaperonin GroEL